MNQKVKIANEIGDLLMGNTTSLKETEKMPNRRIRLEQQLNLIKQVPNT